MPIEVTEFQDKRYMIDGAEFKLKKPTLGIKRRGAALTSILILKLQEMSAISTNYLNEVGDVDTIDKEIKKNKKKLKTDGIAIAGLYEDLCTAAEKINEINEEIFAKAEELFKIILEPINLEDKDKLVADNLDENMITQVVQDFFQLAGLSMTPAKN